MRTRSLAVAALAAVLPAVAGAAALAAPARTAGWALVPVPSPPKSFGTNLNGVACRSAAACVAVGDYFTTKTGDSHAMAMRWNGTRWAFLHTPSSGNVAYLNGASCPSATACTAVGAFVSPGGGPNNQRPLAEQWDGARWVKHPVPGPAGGTDIFLTSVSCPAVRTCLAVGGFVPGNHRVVALAERWNGASWAIETRGLGAGDLSGISCSSAGACTAVGSGPQGTPLAARWNGTRWSVQRQPALPAESNGTLDAVSCASVTSCMAVGTYSGASGLPHTLAEHWDGARWMLQPVPVPAGLNGSDRAAVSCRSARHCTLAGDVTDAGGIGLRSLAEGWNGTSWSIQPNPSPAGQLAGFTSVSCATRTACLAVGSYVSHGRITAFAELRR